MSSTSFKNSVSYYNHYKIWKIKISLDNINSAEEFSVYLTYFLSSVSRQTFNPEEYNFILLDVIYSNGNKNVETVFSYPIGNDDSKFSEVFNQFKFENHNNLTITVRYEEEGLRDKENWPFL